MKVYVAGSSSDIRRVRQMQAFLGLLGIQVTHDWTPPVRLLQSGREFSREERISHANADLVGVDEADCVLLLVPAEPSGGGNVFEAGYAYKAGKPVFVSLQETDNVPPHVFCDLLPCFKTDAEAVEAICELRTGRVVFPYGPQK